MSMSLSRRALLGLSSALAVVLPSRVSGGAEPETPLTLHGNRVTWLGFSTVRVETADGRTFLVDPWLSFPGCSLRTSEIGRLDGILITHGHWQHIGDAVELARAKNAPVLAVEEVAVWLKQAGVRNTPQVNIGATVAFAGISVSVTPAVHTSGILDKTTGKISYGGDPVGFVLHLPGGSRIYHAGDTDVFGDMALIRERYAPQLGLLPIGDVTTMGPSGAALACRLLDLDVVVPMHFDLPTFSGTPAALESELRERRIRTQMVALRPGATLA
jgi:L-ascorbate metabolism protein UlaG (beta-lactamase superfamily)